MKTQSTLFAVLASVPAALAHTTFTDFFVDGVAQGDGVAIRMNPHPSYAGSPVRDLGSDDMACNVEGTKGVGRVQPVQDGALLTFEMRSWADDPSKPSLSRGHYGPCAMYLKKVDSAVDDTAAGDGWFKIFDHGYDADTKRWCTDELIDNNGLFNINLPKGLAGGQYLVRPEILALHQVGNPEFYTGCAQINLESNGNLGPESTVSIPGHVKAGEPSCSINIYSDDLTTYKMPGPSVAKLVAKGDSAGISTTYKGAKPEGCIVENANWCGKEVSSYSDETGCWAADKECWAQSKSCYDSVGPTGHAGCDIWQSKCQAIQDGCKSGNFNGPPNKGKNLMPQKKTIDVGKIMATVGGGIVDAPSTPKTETPYQPTSTPAAEQNKPEPEQAEDDYSQEEQPAAAPQAPSSPEAKPTPTPGPTPAPAAPAQPDDSSNYSPPAKDDNNNDYNKPEPVPAKEDDVVSSITAAPAAPKPTAGPPCVPGGKCVTVTEMETVVQTVYVTMAADSYKRGVEGFKARRRHARSLH